MAKSLSGGNFKEGKPKKTRQGQGSHSKPKADNKRYRGQGKGWLACRISSVVEQRFCKAKVVGSNPTFGLDPGRL